MNETKGISAEVRTALIILAIKSIAIAQQANLESSPVSLYKVRAALDEIEATVREAQALEEAALERAYGPKKGKMNVSILRRCREKTSFFRLRDTIELRDQSVEEFLLCFMLIPLRDLSAGGLAVNCDGAVVLFKQQAQITPPFCYALAHSPTAGHRFRRRIGSDRRPGPFETLHILGHEELDRCGPDLAELLTVQKACPRAALERIRIRRLLRHRHTEYDHERNKYRKKPFHCWFPPFGWDCKEVLYEMQEEYWAREAGSAGVPHRNRMPCRRDFGPHRRKRMTTPNFLTIVQDEGEQG